MFFKFYQVVLKKVALKACFSRLFNHGKKWAKLPGEH